jgi:glutamine synthetase
MIRIPLTVSFYKNKSHSRFYSSYILEYVWIDGRGNLRSKCRTAYPSFDSGGGGSNSYIVAKDWNYDGSSTHQTFSTENGEMALIPVAHFLNPFFDPGRAFLILCETRFSDGTPAETNFRCDAVKVFDAGARKQDPRFAIEQKCFVPEFLTVNLRTLAEKHYEYCLQAGIKIAGINVEVAPSQWEFQIGPCSCIDAGDHLWVARYILHKLGEEFAVCISFKSGPTSNSCTLNTTFSTEESRSKDGLKCIYKYIDRLWKKHAHDAAGMQFGAASIHVPKSVLKAGCGYLEDRRSPSYADPYQVIAAIFSGACICAR